MASQDLVSHHWDLYRDVNGIRPRWYDYESMTDEELNSEIAWLYRDLRTEQEQDAWWDAMEAEAERVSHLYNSEPLPYEEYYS